MKLETSGSWVGTRTGTGVFFTLFWSQPMAPLTSAAAYECAAAQSMDPWFATKKALILKNIMFCTDGKISVRINLPLFSTVVPFSIFMFLSFRPFVVITTLSTGLVGVEVTSVSWLGQLTVGV